MSTRFARLSASLVFLSLFAGCDVESPSPAVATPPGEGLVESVARVPRCKDWNPEREAFFGDLHVHTVNSSDAWMFGVRVTPDGAYRYAFGEEVEIPSSDPTIGSRAARIDRPLDFAAVTDHAEFLGETILCVDPTAEGYDSSFCETFRSGEGRAPTLIFRIMSPWTWRDGDVCGSEGERCAEASAAIWKQTVESAERWNDESPDCERVTFPAYEYSSHRLGSNLHRNVIFRNATVPDHVTSYLEARREWNLWEALRRDCLDAGTGCDVLAIPHNSNISNGRMFAVDYPGTSSLEEERERARLRARVEPLVEIMQHKGDSECRNGIEGVLGGVDELCDFEKFENLAFSTMGHDSTPESCYDGPLADLIPHLGPDCMSPRSYARYALVQGLEEEERLGVNPFKFGLMASTDTHNGLAGGVAERAYPGHLGLGDDETRERTTYDGDVPGNASNNPGGLIGVWAEENSRDALFSAMKRREVFGTSGPRIQVRFFGGWDYPRELCAAPDLIAQAYAGGVAMGGDLPARTSGAPTFVTVGMRDPGTPDAPGGLLQRLQIIKGWADDEGKIHQKIYDVAGNAQNGASVDPSTCEPEGPGHDLLCAVWQDPDFEPGRRSVYYARAVENPSCRYTTWQCLEASPAERGADCDTDVVPKTIQERAWSSPIWFSPSS